MKKIFLTIALLLSIIAQPVQAKIEQRFLGRLFLAVQSNDDGLWYVNPKDGKRYSIQSNTDALDIIQKNLSVVKKIELQRIQNKIPTKYNGRFISSESVIYYADPVKKQLKKIGKADEAYDPLRYIASGISNVDLAKISLGNAEKYLNKVSSAQPGTFCNGKYWTPCPSGQKFTCSTSGDAYCADANPIQNNAAKNNFDQLKQQQSLSNVLGLLEQTRREKNLQDCLADFKRLTGSDPLIGDPVSSVRFCNQQYNSDPSYFSDQSQQLNDLQKKQEQQLREFKKEQEKQKQKLEDMKREQEEKEWQDRFNCIGKGTWFNGRCDYKQDTKINLKQENILSPTKKDSSKINILPGTGTSYSQIGNTLYGSDRSSYSQIGNTIYGNNGTSYSTIGNTTYGSDGSSFSQIGNTIYGNDGTSYSKIGNTIYGSDGSSASKIGNTIYTSPGYKY